jgi:hypothetical protein
MSDSDQVEYRDIKLADYDLHHILNLLEKEYDHLEATGAPHMIIYNQKRLYNRILREYNTTKHAQECIVDGFELRGYDEEIKK